MLYERTATYEFDDYPGLEVVMRVSVPLRRYFEIESLLNDLPDGPDGWQTIASVVDEFRVSWTLDGDAFDQPRELLMGIAVTWWRSIGRVPPPLPRRSGDIEPSPAPSTDPETSPTPSQPTSSSEPTPATPSRRSSTRTRTRS